MVFPSSVRTHDLNMVYPTEKETATLLVFAISSPTLHLPVELLGVRVNERKIRNAAARNQKGNVLADLDTINATI